jgi:predicted amidohydrolase YtcJ
LQQQLPVRLRVTYTVEPGSEPQMDIDSIVRMQYRTGMGDDWLKLGAVKMFVDGSDGKGGILFRRDQNVLNEQIMKAHRAGWQIMVHALTLPGQDLTLNAFETVLKAYPRPDSRHRIEHLGGALDMARLERAKKLGLIVVPTPSGIAGLSRARARQAIQPWHSLIAMGFHPPGSSDTAGTRTAFINPMLNIYWLVTRRNEQGEVNYPEEAVSVKDALRIYTTWGAYAGFEEKIKGSVEVGKLADLVVLSADLLAIPPESIKDVKADATIIDGQVRYERKVMEKGTN